MVGDGHSTPCAHALQKRFEQFMYSAGTDHGMTLLVVRFLIYILTSGSIVSTTIEIRDPNPSRPSP